MGRFPLWLLPGLAVLVAGAGCAHLGKGGRGEGPPVADKPPQELPVVQRVHREALFLGLPVPPPSAVPAEPPAVYKALTAQYCRCRAAEVQGVANMLDADADAIAEQEANRLLKCLPGQQKVAALKIDVLRATAAEARNLAAGTALAVFFRLVEAETLSDLQLESLAVIDETLARVRDLKDKGLQARGDVEAVERQRHDLLAERLRLQLNIDDLTMELNRFLDLEISPCACKGRFWPVFELHFPNGPECAAAVAEGLAKRPELFMLQRISEEITVQNLPTIRKALQSVSGLAGMSESKPLCPTLAGLLAVVCNVGAVAAELQTRREQVDEYRIGRERAIAGEITVDARGLVSQAQLVTLSRARARSWQERVEELQAKFPRGLATLAELTDARLQWLRARGDVIKDVTAWERTLVLLQLHQGVLHTHCDEGPAPSVGTEPPHALEMTPRQDLSTFSTRLGEVLSSARGPE